MLQPEFFVEISEELRRRRASSGGWVRVWSKRGSVKAKAVVTKRIKPLTCDGKTVHIVGIPLHWGFIGAAKKGFGPNRSRPSSATPTSRRRNSRRSWSISSPRPGRWREGGRDHVPSDPQPDRRPSPPKFGEQDLIRRSASTITPPAERQTEVAKLIDVSKCIGCKACQSACIEWNDTARARSASIIGVYDNPPDLTPDMFTLMRFTEWENPETQNLEWLIRKDGCMHCEDPGCLKACPAPGAIVQYSNGIVDFVHENCIGCGYCVKGCPFNIPRISKVDHKAYKCTLCSDRVAVGQGPACQKACPTQAIVFGTKEEMKEHGPTAASRT